MIIIGIDEVGRGCWAGPLVAGAVRLDNQFTVPENSDWRLDDSKRLTQRQREAAEAALCLMGVDYNLGWVTANEIDTIGLSAAVALAMRRAVNGLLDEYNSIIIDGSINFLPDIPRTQAVIKADGSVSAVSAASIIAKVARDRWMTTVAAAQYPGYGFERHVGYGTKEHQAALVKLGPCAVHRYSYKPVRACLK